MNVDALIAYVMNTPLSWIIITISAYKIGILIYEKSGKHALLQPIVIAYVIMLPILLLAKIPYKQYFDAVFILHFFLGPATVALALPLYIISVPFNIFGVRFPSCFDNEGKS